MRETSKSRFTIDVTDERIERARIKGQGDSFNCVVVQTIAATLPDAHHIEADSQTIRFTLNGERLVYLTPYVVSGYIAAFDAGDPLRAFRFQLRDPVRRKRSVLTDAGKAVHRARKRRDNVKKQRVKTSSKGLHPKDSDTIAAAEAEFEGVKAAYEGVPKAKSDKGGPKAPPRVFKTKKRVYGSRVLRINRENQLSEGAAD